MIKFSAWDTAPNEAWSVHHRLSQFWGGETRWPYQNGIKIPDRIHKCWHTMFKSWPAEWIIDEINAKYAEPSVKYVPVLFTRGRIPEPEGHRHMRERRNPRHELWNQIFPAHLPPHKKAEIMSQLVDSQCLIFACVQRADEEALVAG